MGEKIKRWIKSKFHKTKKKKKPFHAMEMTKINLNPEQAVLSCCDTILRGRQNGATQQCSADVPSTCGATSAAGMAISS